MTVALYFNNQELLEKVADHEARAKAAEAKLSDERKRFQKLREDAKRKLEEGAVSKYVPFAVLVCFSENPVWG